MNYTFATRSGKTWTKKFDDDEEAASYILFATEKWGAQCAECSYEDAITLFNSLSILRDQRKRNRRYV